MSATICQLEIFNEVVESGQVTKAARKRYLTQYILSLAFSEMEIS